MNIATSIDSPAKCESRNVIRFLQAEGGNSEAEIHRTVSRVYGEKFMTNGVVREWFRKFKSDRTDVHDEGGQGRKSVATDDLVQRVDEVVRDNRRFTISILSMKFPEVSKFSLYSIVKEHFRLQKTQQFIGGNIL